VIGRESLEIMEFFVLRRKTSLGYTGGQRKKRRRELIQVHGKGRLRQSESPALRKERPSMDYAPDTMKRITQGIKEKKNAATSRGVERSG